MHMWSRVYEVNRIYVINMHVCILPITLPRYFATACRRAGPRESWTRKRERERERERPSLFILIFTRTFTTRLSACLAERLTDATHAHAHTHTQRQRQRRRGGASAGHAAPADRGRPSLRKNNVRRGRRRKKRRKLLTLDRH